MWGMRWWSNQLEESFPGTFQIGCNKSIPTNEALSHFFSLDDCPASFAQLYAWPLFNYFVLWATPYYIFFFLLGKTALARAGYYTMFDDMAKKPAVRRAITIGGDWGQEFK